MQFQFTSVRGANSTGIELGEIFLYGVDTKDADGVVTQGQQLNILNSYHINCYGECSETKPASNLIDGRISSVWYDNGGFGCGQEACSGDAKVTLVLPHPIVLGSYRLYTGQGNPANDPTAWRFGILRDDGEFQEISAYTDDMHVVPLERGFQYELFGAFTPPSPPAIPEPPSPPPPPNPPGHPPAIPNPPFQPSPPFSPPPTPPPLFELQGRAIDGPLGECTAFYDADGDQELGFDEPTPLPYEDSEVFRPGRTDGEGRYTMQVDLAPLSEKVDASGALTLKDEADTVIIVDPYTYLALDYGDGSEQAVFDLKVLRAGRPNRPVAGPRGGHNINYCSDVNGRDDKKVFAACGCKDRYTGLPQRLRLSSVPGMWLAGPGTIVMISPFSQLAYSWLQYIADEGDVTEDVYNVMAEQLTVSLGLPVTGTKDMYGTHQVREAEFGGAAEIKLDLPNYDPYNALSSAVDGSDRYDGLVAAQLLIGMAKVSSLATQLAYILAGVRVNHTRIPANHKGMVNSAVRQEGPVAYYTLAQALATNTLNATNDVVEDGVLDDMLQQAMLKQGLGLGIASLPSGVPSALRRGLSVCMSQYDADLLYLGEDGLRTLPINYTENSDTGQTRGERGELQGVVDPNMTTRISIEQQVALQEIIFEVTRTAYVCNKGLPEMMMRMVRGVLDPEDFDAEITPDGFSALLSFAEDSVMLQVGRTYSPPPPPLPPHAPPESPPPLPPANPPTPVESEAGLAEIPLEEWLPPFLLGLVGAIILVFLGVVYHLSGGAVLTYLRLMGSHSNPSIMAGYLPKGQRDRMRKEVALRKRAHDDPLVFYQQQADNEAAAPEPDTKSVKSSAASDTSVSTVVKKEKKLDIYDMSMKADTQAKLDTMATVEKEEVLPMLGLDDAAAVQRLLQSAYNAQRAFILASQVQQQYGMGMGDEEEEAQAHAAEDRRVAEAAAERLKAVFAKLSPYQAQRAFVAAAQAAAQALEEAEDEEDNEAAQLDEIKLKMEAKGLLAPRPEESYGEITATYGYDEAEAEKGGEDDATGYEESVPDSDDDKQRRRKRRNKVSLEDADMTGVDPEDAATVNLLLGRVGAGLETIDGELIAAIEPGQLAATTPYQVQRAFVAAAEAALNAVEETEAAKTVQEAVPGIDSRTALLLANDGTNYFAPQDDDGAGVPTMTPEERAKAQLDVIMGRSTAPGAMDMSTLAAAPSVLAMRQSALVATSEREPDETEQEATRRIAWIKHYIKLGEYDRAIELGWDGDMDFAASFLNPGASGTGTPTSGAQTPLSDDPPLPESLPESGAQTPFDEAPPNVGAGGAEGGGGGGGTKQLCRI